MKKFSIAVGIAFLAAAGFAASGYKVAKQIPIPGDGGWDYVSVDSQNRRVFVSHGTQVEVLDADTGAIVGSVQAPKADSNGKPVDQQVHGAAVASGLGRGFTTNGRANTMTMFDLKTLKILAEIPVAESPDGFLYDASTKRVFSFSRRAKNASAVDAEAGKPAGNVDLGGVPEAAAADGKGHIYVTIQDQDRVVKFNAKSLATEASWPVAPCHEPTSAAMDAKNKRLFIGCRGKQFVAINIDTGKVVATLPIGQGTDAAVFDPSQKTVFISNGEGTVTVIRQESPDRYTVADTVKTAEGAKTMGLDMKTHKLFLSTADRITEPAQGNQPPVRKVTPGTFRVLVLDR